ncbi:MAG: flavodoxin domain-containing protein, partial [Anaerolineaceae bacterium]|nr:flavodoxin domain-containing protein [Anaerolineaceae bacterium]
MEALVIYDSVFGNTEKVAKAIGAALGESTPVVQVSGFNLEQLNGVQYLFVGSPTRGFQPTPAVKNMLKSLPNGALKGVKVAAFDTRIAVEETNSGFLKFMVGIFGYAAEKLHKMLVKKGGEVSISDNWFFVKDSEG